MTTPCFLGCRKGQSCLFKADTNNKIYTLLWLSHLGNEPMSLLEKAEVTRPPELQESRSCEAVQIPGKWPREQSLNPVGKYFLSTHSTNMHEFYVWVEYKFENDTCPPYAPLFSFVNVIFKKKLTGTGNSAQWQNICMTGARS